MRAAANRLAVAAVLLILAGCVTPPETIIDRPPEPALWSAHVDAIRSVHTWEAEGRVAAELGGESASGSVSWSQSFDLVDFHFRGPFGIGGFQIAGDEDGLRIRTSRGDDILLRDPVADMQAEFGWALPVHAMRYWILGVPAPEGEAELAFSTDGQLVGLNQAGWQVEVDDYQELAGFTVPRRVTMRGDGVELRFVVDRWAPEMGEPPEGTEL